MFQKAVPWVCLVAAFGLARMGAAAQLKGVQSGTVTITGGTTSVTDTLSPAVVPAKSFLVFGISGSNNAPNNIQVSGQLTNSTTVTFRRIGSAGSITVHWYVAEFLSGVNVQRGTQQLPGAANPADTDVAISTVDLTKSFPLISFRTDGTGYDSNDSIRAKLTTTTNLRLFAQDAGLTAFVEWQVVEYVDANVQTGDVHFNSGDTSQPASLAPAVITAKSWLVFSHESVTGPPDIGRTLVRGVVTDGSNLTFDRNNTGSSIDLTWYLVEFTDAATVQHNTEPFTTTELQRNVTLGSPANAGSSIAAGGYHGRGGRSSFATDDDAGVGWFTLDLTSNTNLQITRGTTGGDTATADIGWFVVDFVANSCAPLNVSETGNSITVTAPADFEMMFHTAAGGSIREMYDLQEDPGKANDLAGALIGSGSSMGLHNAGMRIGAPHFNAGEDPGGYLELLEATPTRVKVRQLSDYSDVNVRLPGVEAEGDYTVLPSGKIGLRWTRKTTTSVTYVLEYVEAFMHQTSSGPLSGRVVSSETSLVSPGAGGDDFLLGVIDNAGPPPARTDFLFVIHEDWDTVNGYSETADTTNWFFQAGAERVNPGWVESTGQALGAGDVETWNVLTYFRPRTLLNNAEPAVTARSADYRVPDRLTIGIGGNWTHASENTGAGDDFNESEVAYVMEADPSMDPTLRVDIDGGGGATRYAPFFKIREWRSLQSPTVTLQASPLAQGVDFQSDVKPVSRSYFADELLWHSTAQNAAAWTTTPDVGTGGFASGAITYVPGRYGNGVNMPANSETLSFPTSNFDKFQGAVEFWFQPTYAHDDGVGRDIGGFFFDASNAWFLQKTVTDNRLHFRIVASGVSSDLWVDPADYEWQAAEWVHLRIEWDETAGLGTQQRLYINGVEPLHTGAASDYVAANLTVAGSFNLGNNTNGSGNFGPGIYDEIRSYGGSTVSPDAIAHGGLTSDTNEYLASSAQNYTFKFNAVDGNSRGRYLYFGTDSQFHGLNVALATRGVGTATLVWEYWDGTQWAGLAGFGFTDETMDFTADGTIYWTDPTGWATYSVNGSPDLYYVRVYATAVAYSTLPIEGLIKTDILLFQYCGDVTANAQRFEFALPIPTVVELIGFDAAGVDGEVELRWETGSELNNLGFHLYRAPSAFGPYERITSNLIPGLGSSPSGGRYRYLDSNLVNGVTYFYELEDVETTGATERHGPVAATPEAGVSLPGDVAEERDSASRISYDTPESSSLRVLPTKRGVVLELDTTGFVAVPQDDGTVRLVVPGLDEHGTSLPSKRTWVDALAGRNVEIVSVHALDVEAFDGLRPASAATPELVVSSEGTVRVRRQRQVQRIYRSERARLVTVAYQGKEKKALVELSPFSWDGSRLWLARKLRVRLAFQGREIQSKDRSHRRRGVTAHLVTGERGLYAVPLQELLGRQRSRTSRLRLSRQGSSVPYHIEGNTFYFWSDGERVNPYAREAVYELELGVSGESMEVVDSATSPRGTFHWHAVEREATRYYQAALMNAPDVWLWELLFATERKSFGFDAHHLASVSESSFGCRARVTSPLWSTITFVSM